MRNCFVPQCDQQCRSMAKRMMFMPRTPEALERWRQALPKRKEFKRSDRVCERHFQPADICTHWAHNIGGQLVHMRRDKPTLRPDAVPTLNLEWTKPATAAAPRQPTKTSSSSRTTRIVSFVPAKPALTRVTRRVPKMDAAAIYSEQEAGAEELFVVPRSGGLKLVAAEQAAEIEQGAEDVEMLMGSSSGDHDEQLELEYLVKQLSEPEVEELPEGCSVTEIASDCQQAETDGEDRRLEAEAERQVEASEVEEPQQQEEEALFVDTSSFEQLYDDVYEVMLPSTMYGIHRDAERSGIVFSLFDVRRMRATKVLHVDSRMRVSTYVEGRLFRQLVAEELSAELVTEWLAELDARPMCAGLERGGGATVDGGAAKCALLLEAEGEVGEGGLCAGCSR